MPTIGTCKLCRHDDVELLESHFVSRKLYYSGKKKLGFVNFIDAAGVDPEELKAHLLCRKRAHKVRTSRLQSAILAIPALQLT